jgi:hypothetical protein
MTERDQACLDDGLAGQQTPLLPSQPLVLLPLPLSLLRLSLLPLPLLGHRRSPESATK